MRAIIIFIIAILLQVELAHAAPPSVTKGTANCSYDKCVAICQKGNGSGHCGSYCSSAIAGRRAAGLCP